MTAKKTSKTAAKTATAKTRTPRVRKTANKPEEVKEATIVPAVMPEKLELAQPSAIDHLINAVQFTVENVRIQKIDGGLRVEVSDGFWDAIASTFIKK